MKEDPVEIAALITKMLWAVVTISQKINAHTAQHRNTQEE